MHISYPIRFPEDRMQSMPEQPPARDGVALAAVLFTFVAILFSVALAAHGMMPACAQDTLISCDAP